MTDQGDLEPPQTTDAATGVPTVGTADRLMALSRVSGPLVRDLPADPFQDLYDPVSGAPR